MALITVYDTEGQPHERESIDAAECVRECGWSLTAPEVETDAPEVEPKQRKPRG